MTEREQINKKEKRKQNPNGNGGDSSSRWPDGTPATPAKSSRRTGATLAGHEPPSCHGHGLPPDRPRNSRDKHK